MAACPILGFKVRVAPPDEESRAQLMADLTAVLREHDLVAAISGDEMTITREGTQATDPDRRLVVDWALRRAVRVVVSDLIDLTEQ